MPLKQNKSLQIYYIISSWELRRFMQILSNLSSIPNGISRAEIFAIYWNLFSFKFLFYAKFIICGTQIPNQEKSVIARFGPFPFQMHFFFVRLLHRIRVHHFRKISSVLMKFHMRKFFCVDGRRWSWSIKDDANINLWDIWREQATCNYRFGSFLL